MLVHKKKKNVDILNNIHDKKFVLWFSCSQLKPKFDVLLPILYQFCIPWPNTYVTFIYKSVNEWHLKQINYKIAAKGWLMINVIRNPVLGVLDTIWAINRRFWQRLLMIIVYSKIKLHFFQKFYIGYWFEKKTNLIYAC